MKLIAPIWSLLLPNELGTCIWFLDLHRNHASIEKNWMDYFSSGGYIS